MTQQTSDGGNIDKVPMDEYAIELNNLTKYYGNVRGIEDVSFTVEQGQIHGFLGPNGAGKTTTIRILIGLLNPTSGSASILGHKAGTIPAKQLTGYLPSGFELYSHYTAGEYLDYLERLRGVEAPYREELVVRFDLDETRLTKELSTGNRQKVSIVQALMHEPALLIADEPTSGLDPIMQAEFDQYLQEYVGRGNTAFISSHILTEVQDVADKVTVIREGHVIESGKVNELLKNIPRKAILRFTNGTNVDKILSQLDVELAAKTPEWISVYYDMSPVKLVDQLKNINEIDDFSLPEPSLEEYFLPLYRKGELDNSDLYTRPRSG